MKRRTKTLYQLVEDESLVDKGDDLINCYVEFLNQHNNRTFRNFFEIKIMCYDGTLWIMPGCSRPHEIKLLKNHLLNIRFEQVKRPDQKGKVVKWQNRSGKTKVTWR
jgi:hypothetical protein